MNGKNPPWYFDPFGPQIFEPIPVPIPVEPIPAEPITSIIPLPIPETNGCYDVYEGPTNVFVTIPTGKPFTPSIGMVLIRERVSGDEVFKITGALPSIAGGPCPTTITPITPSSVNNDCLCQILEALKNLVKKIAEGNSNAKPFPAGDISFYSQVNDDGTAVEKLNESLFGKPFRDVLSGKDIRQWMKDEIALIDTFTSETIGNG